MFKLNKSAACVAAALLAVGAGSAQAARLDPFGMGGLGGIYEVANLGWNNGNAISTPIVTDSGASSDPSVGDTIQTYGHAKLQGLNDSDGNSFVISGFNPNNWTYVFGFSEIVTGVDPAENSTVLQTKAVAGQANFFQIWVGGKAATDLTGKGFNGDGGATLVLSGKIKNFDPITGIGQTSFDSSAVTAGNLDQFGTNQYAGYSSIAGTGAGKINVEIDTVNDKYFLDGIALLTLDVITDTFQNLPFIQVNPSSCFWNGVAYVSGAGNGITDGCGTAADGGTIGFLNGVDTRGNSDWTNVIFQTRATTVLPTIPEPGTLALLGFGALGLFVRRRKS